MHGAIIKATCATVTVPIPGLDPTSMPNLIPAGNGVTHRKSNKQAGLIELTHRGPFSIFVSHFFAFR